MSSLKLLPDADFRFLAEVLRRGSGLHLDEKMDYLISSRLEPLCQELGSPDVASLISKLRHEPSYYVEKRINEAMSTHESYFFRDGKPFDIFRDHILPLLREKRSIEKRLRVWSGACSTGQEPFSLAMIFEESHLDWSNWNIEILATDFSEAVLERARTGVFSAFDVKRGLTESQLQRHFVPRGDDFELKDRVKSKVRFQHLNLLQPLLLENVDVVFLRNVLIYFDVETKAKILNEVASVVKPDGHLFLGGAESVYSLSELWESVPEIEGSVFRKKALKG